MLQIKRHSNDLRIKAFWRRKATTATWQKETQVRIFVDFTFLSYGNGQFLVLAGGGVAGSLIPPCRLSSNIITSFILALQNVSKWNILYEKDCGLRPSHFALPPPHTHTPTTYHPERGLLFIYIFTLLDHKLSGIDSSHFKGSLLFTMPSTELETHKVRLRRCVCVCVSIICDKNNLNRIITKIVAKHTKKKQN